MMKTSRDLSLILISLVTNQRVTDKRTDGLTDGIRPTMTIERCNISQTAR